MYFDFYDRRCNTVPLTPLSTYTNTTSTIMKTTHRWRLFSLLTSIAEVHTDPRLGRHQALPPGLCGEFMTAWQVECFSRRHAGASAQFKSCRASLAIVNQHVVLRIVVRPREAASGKRSPQHNGTLNLKFT